MEDAVAEVLQSRKTYGYARRCELGRVKSFPAYKADQCRCRHTFKKRRVCDTSESFELACAFEDFVYEGNFLPA